MEHHKFKFWLGHTRKMTYAHTLPEIASVIKEFTPDIIARQFTGLKDKNGQEIYEGDILEHYDFEDGSTKLRIGWYQGLYNMVAYYGLGETDYITMEEVEHEHEIIGNIYENPELIA